MGFVAGVSALGATPEEQAQKAWALYSRFREVEDAALMASLGGLVSGMTGGGGEGETLVSDLLGLTKLVDELLGRLIAARLVANDRSIPLLSMADRGAVAADVLGLEPGQEKHLGLDGSDEAINAVVMAMATPVVVKQCITAKLIYLRAIDDDLYDTVWTRIEAIIAVAEANGVSVEVVIENDTYRSEVYRRCMTPEQWRQLAEHVVEAISSSTVSSAGSEVADMMADPVDAAELTVMFSVPDPRAAEVRERACSLLREAYAARGREIWPDSF